MDNRARKRITVILSNVMECAVMLLMWKNKMVLLQSSDKEKEEEETIAAN